MILNLFRKKSDSSEVLAIYSAIVAQSRSPRFYAEWGVPDTVTGRFDMICVHLALCFRRLRGPGQAERDIAQAVFDFFFKDMDRQLREMGVTDIGVPKKIQKMGNVFYGLLAAMNVALDRNDASELAAVLERNVFAGIEHHDAAALAAYVMERDAVVSRNATADLLGGRIDFGGAP